jgi:3-oxoacyl-[acyl-carrier protein] reductase
MDLGIKGRRALVMGGSRGLGRAIAEALIVEGAVTAICARDKARLDRAARDIGAQAFPADLSKPGAAAQLMNDVIARLGGLDILIVNTGGPPPRNFDNTSDGDWREAFEALWMSSVSAIRAALPGMRMRKWGRILLVTSIAAREPISNLLLSNGLRAGLHGLVNALSKECAGQGITVNALMPGFTLTERLVEVGVKEEEMAARIPAGRMGRPAEFAALAAFLASDQAGYITGQAIACDGGLLQSI